MLIVREAAPNVFAELSFSPSITGPGAVYPWQIVDLWSDAELATLGIYRVTVPNIPEGKSLVSYTITRVSDVVTYVPTYEDAPPPKLIATPRQIRLALTQFGLRQTIEDYVNTQDITVKDSWEYTTEFEIDHPIIVAGQAALSISDEQVRALFALAVTL